VQGAWAHKVSTNLRVQPGERSTPLSVRTKRSVELWAAPWPIGRKPRTKKTLRMSRKKRERGWFSFAPSRRGRPVRPPRRQPKPPTQRSPAHETAPIAAGWSPVSWSWICRILFRGSGFRKHAPARMGSTESRERPGGRTSRSTSSGCRARTGASLRFHGPARLHLVRQEKPVRIRLYRNNLCGQLPIRIGKGPKDEPEFASACWTERKKNASII